MVSLSPAVPVQGKVMARTEPGLALPLSHLRRLLRRCPGDAQIWKQPLEIRFVRLKTLARFKPTRADRARRGRYLRPSQTSPAIIYVGDGPDKDQSLLHEWLHHQDEVIGRNHRSEATIEAAARRCRVGTPLKKQP